MTPGSNYRIPLLPSKPLSMPRIAHLQMSYERQALDLTYYYSILLSHLPTVWLDFFRRLQILSASTIKYCMESSSDMKITRVKTAASAIRTNKSPSRILQTDSRDVRVDLFPILKSLQYYCYNIVLYS